MKNKLFILTCLVLLNFTLKAQMKVGDNPTTINSASLLELESGTKGLVFPRVPLANVASPLPLPAGLLAGTVVYNTNAAIVNGNGTGLYLWGGSVWMSVNTGATSATAWSLTGNAGTSYTTNFIGTTDNVGFRVRTNNLQRILVDSLGNVAIGSTAFNSNNRERLLVDYGTTTSHTVANFRGNINDFFQVNIQNTSNGKSASSDYVATADDGTDSTFFVDMGINGSRYQTNPENWGGFHDAYLYSNSRNLMIGVQADSSDIYFLSGGGQIKLNTALQIKGPSGVIVVGKGDLTDAPVGNIIRGPNANADVSNLAGGDLSLAGGRSTGTARGGDLNLSGGATLGSAAGGNVNILSGSSGTGAGGTVYINTTLSTGNVRIGSGGNNIIFPKFSTVGGLFYTSLTAGQVSSTGANMTWDSINNRLGIGTTAPGYKLSVLGTNPLYLGGVQATGNFSADSILTINGGVVKKAPYSALPSGGSGWSLTGNSGTNPSTNFIGTTNGVDFVVRTNSIERMRVLGAAVGTSQAGWVGIGNAAPRSRLDVTGTFANKNVVTIQNTEPSGYSSVDMFDNSGTLSGTFGYANPGVTGNDNIKGRDYFFFYGKDFIMTAGAGGTAGSNPDLFVEGTNGNIGVNTSNPSQKLDIVGNLELNGAFMPAGDAGTPGEVLTSAGAGNAPLWQPGLTKLKGSVTLDPGTIAANSTNQVQINNLTGLAGTSAVIINPRTQLPPGFAIAYCYVNSPTQILVGILNARTSSASPGAITYDVTVIP